MKTVKLIFYVCVLSSFFACSEKDIFFDNDRRVTGHGEVVTDEVYVNDFTSIDLQNVSNVYVTIGEGPKVLFTAYENILPYMEADNVGDELLLRFNKNISVNSKEEIRVDITVPVLDKVTLSGVGNFYLNGPFQESLKMELDGVGNMEAYSLPVNHCKIELNGTGNIKIKVKEMLEVDLDGLGNVYYQGDPETNIDINGLGEVIRD
jgi:hypothetical protein